MARLSQMMGGTLKPSDPRRFLIEAMIGAISADGVADDRERAVLSTQLAEHELFASLSESAATMLVELASDAIRFAGDAIARVPAIARGLPSRSHRLAAYAMACAVCAAADDIDEAETRYLEALRTATGVGADEADRIGHAARSAGGRATATTAVDRELEAMYALAPLVCDLVCVATLAGGVVTDDDRTAAIDYCDALVDVALPRQEIEERVGHALRHAASSGVNVGGELDRLARAMPREIDRYWLTVYALAWHRRRDGGDWQGNPFFGQLGDAFDLDHTDLSRASSDAALL